MDLYLMVKNEIMNNHRIDPGDHVILGLSGGADSVCLLLCLSRLRTELGFTLSAVHVNHGLRGAAADADGAFATELCRRFCVDMTLASVDIRTYIQEHGGSEEEAGRILRYEIFDREAARMGTERPVKIAVAHHMDDQAETVLMNLCRGTGIRGLGGIPEKNGNRIRPLLNVRRAQIEEWLRSQGQTWREDATNQGDDYTRNRVRHEILPRLESLVNARSAEHIAAMAAQARQMDVFLEEMAQMWIAEHLQGISEDAMKMEAGEQNSGELCVCKADLLALPKLLQTRIWQRLLERMAGAAKDITARHLDALVGLTASPAGKQLDLPYGLCAVAGKTSVTLRRRRNPEEESFAIYEILPDEKKICRIGGRNLVIETERKAYSGQKIPENRYTKWFDYDKINAAMQLRSRQSEDVICLSGVGRKRLRRYMIDEGIPAENRGRIPILAVGDQVLWVVGHRMSSAYQVGPDTVQILEVRIADVKG